MTILDSDNDGFNEDQITLKQTSVKLDATNSVTKSKPNTMLVRLKRFLIRQRLPRAIKIFVFLVIALLCLFLVSEPHRGVPTSTLPVAEKLQMLESSKHKLEESIDLNGYQEPTVNPYEKEQTDKLSKPTNLDSSVDNSTDAGPHISHGLNQQLPKTKDVTEESQPTIPPHFFDSGLLPSGRISAAASNTMNRPLTRHQFKQENVTPMQNIVREAMQHSWSNYKRYAWGHDMLKPRTYQPALWFNLGLTIVDSTDTLIMMGMSEETEDAIQWIENKLDFDKGNENSNCFELTIRILGGLLSVYHLVPRVGVLAKATDIGTRLLNCYDSGSRVVPLSDIDLGTKFPHAPVWDQRSSLAEVSSLQLEFRDLARLTGDTNFETTTFQTSQHIHKLVQQNNSSILPMFIDPVSGQLSQSRLTLGARSDSYYEYLLKQYLQTGIGWLVDDYLNAVDEIAARMVSNTPGPLNLTFIGELLDYSLHANGTKDYAFYAKMDHLVCFFPGTLALGYYHFSPKAQEVRAKYDLSTHNLYLNPRFDPHLDLAKRLARTCWHMYNGTATGLAPEIANFGTIPEEPEYIVQSSSAHNILRPEYVESLFYLYHITNDQVYRYQATLIMNAFNKYARVNGGYAPVSDVRQTSTDHAQTDTLDRMESFWMSETLKYLYLTFSDDINVVSSLLNNYIFNTEGHLIPRQQGPAVDV